MRGDIWCIAKRIMQVQEKEKYFRMRGKVWINLFWYWQLI